MLVSGGTRHLAGHTPGLRYVDRGRMSLKGISDPVHALRVAWEDEADTKEGSHWVLMVFGGQSRLGWKPLLLVIAVAAVTAGAVVYLTTETTANRARRERKSPPAQAPYRHRRPQPHPGRHRAGAALGRLRGANGSRRERGRDRRLPAAERRPRIPARTAGSIARCYANGRLLRAAYDRSAVATASRATRASAPASSGAASTPWEHGPGKPGGRVFCYFDGDDAVIVWMHERLGQASHRDILAIAREGGSDHARLSLWWQPWHHLIGKAL